MLIAGGGPAGLALAIELGWRGVSCILVEQGDGTVEFPTTNLANTRTCEHLRRWGLADRMRYQSGFPTDYPRNYVFVTRMNGYEIERFEHPANGDPQSRSPHSPEGRLWISKPYFDPILHQHAGALPSVDLRYRTALESFRQDGEKVIADVVDTQNGTHATIEAGYLVGCDGGIAIDEMVLIVRLFREHTDLPILACPEAAQRELDGDKIVRKETPGEFAAKIGSLVTAGANVIGGAAGVGPDHIKMAVEVWKQ